MLKSTTHRIAITEPDEQHLMQALGGRKLSPDLVEFLKRLLKTKKWTRKINIPSGYEDVAAVLVFTSILKEEGLQIQSELHIYFHGTTIVESWEVLGEMEEALHLPKEAFQAIDIEKVRVRGDEVTVIFTVPTSDGDSHPIVKSFDFSAEESQRKVVPHPLVGEGRR
jgi:hypothetical protein